MRSYVVADLLVNVLAFWSGWSVFSFMQWLGFVLLGTIVLFRVGLRCFVSFCLPVCLFLVCLPVCLLDGWLVGWLVDFFVCARARFVVPVCGRCACAFVCVCVCSVCLVCACVCVCVCACVLCAVRVCICVNVCVRVRVSVSCVCVFAHVFGLAC